MYLIKFGFHKFQIILEKKIVIHSRGTKIWTAVGQAFAPAWRSLNPLQKEFVSSALTQKGIF